MSNLLGSVAVEVKADLAKLVAGFSEAKRQTQAFSNDLKTATGSANRMWDSVSAFDRRDKIMANIQAWQTALGRVQRATDPVVANQRLVSTALREAEKDYMSGAINATALAKANDLAAPTLLRLKNEAAGLAGGLEKAEGAHTHLLRSVEQGIRAWRLLAVVFGIDMVGRLGKFVVDSLEATAALKNQAEQLGLTTSELQEYRGIAGQVGMASKDMDSAFATLGKNVDDLRLGKLGPFSKLLVDLFGKAGAAAEKLKPISTIFKDMIDKLRDVGDAAQQRGAGVIAFGEAWNKMGELAQRGSTGIDSLREALRATGAIMSEEQIAHADETAKKLDQLKTVLSAKWASTVVENAAAVDKLANALFGLVNAALMLPRYLDGATTSLDNFFTMVLSALPAFGDLLVYMHEYNQLKNAQVADVATEVGQVGHSVDMKLGPAEQKHGPNIKLDSLLAPKGAKAKTPKFDQFEADMDREIERQLQLEHDATGDLARQNEIDLKIIDIKLKEQIEQIKRQMHSKEITATEGKQLIAAAENTAAMEKEAADRKMRVAEIEESNRYADELAQIEQEGLQVARQLARTDQERKLIDMKILVSKQLQAVSEKDKEIALAEEAKDATRVAQLMDERVKLLANQKGELAQFAVDHLTGIEKFRNDLPKTVQEINEQLDRIRFDQFTERLQRAADMAKSIGDAFGQFVGDLASFKNPLEALKSLIGSLAKTMTENVIVKPVSDWATQHIGVPLAKQAFGKAMTSGPDALTPKQFDMALAQATGTLGGFEKVLPGASSGIGAITTAATPASTSLSTLATAAEAAASALTSMAASAGAGGGGGGGGLGGLASLFGGMGGADSGGLGGGTFDILGGGGDMFSPSSLLDAGTLADMSSLGIGFATGGFTGSGADHEPKGVVHANEFVLNSDAVSQYGLPLLGSMNSGSASVLRAGGGPGPARATTAATAATAGGGDLTNAAQMLMQAAQMLMDATKNMGGGGGKGGAGGMLGSLLGIATGALLGGGKGGGIGKMLGGMFGGGGGVVDLTGPAFASQLGHFDSGGFTGIGSDHEPAGVVHKNEYVWDAPTTRQWMPVLHLIGSGRLPSFQGPALGQTKPRGVDPRPQVIHIDEVHLHGVTDERTARQTANQFMGHVQHRTAQVNRRGLNK